MYKDVGKRILAVFMSVCMILGLADFSALTVRADGEIELTAEDITMPSFGVYSGVAHEPAITVTKDGEELIKDTHYTVTMPADMTSVGDKTVTIEGKVAGGYSGTVNKIYKITQKKITNSNDITITVKPQQYNGGAAVAPIPGDV